MKVGILTLPLNDNYGGIIQAAALYHVLETMGHTPEILSKKYWRSLPQRLLGPVLRAIPGHDLQNIRTNERTRAQHYPFLDRVAPRRTGSLYTTASIARYARRHNLQAIIVGSDQVWRQSYMIDRDTTDYFLGFEGDFRKIAYAASFGKSVWTAPERLPAVKKMIADFDHVSLRELSGVTLCKETLERENCVLTIDPTLLVDPGFYDEVIAPQSAPQGYVLNYVLDESEAVQNTVKSVLRWSDDTREVRKISLNDGADTVDIPQWLRAFKDADFVITDSFHGTVFSIIFKKQFICIGNMERGIDRFQSLLSLLDLEDRLVLGDATLSEQPAHIDFAEVDKRLATLKQNSMAFLQTALA